MKLKHDARETAAAYAREAIAKGRTAWVYQMPPEGASSTSGPIASWSDRIEAIEAEGWVLDQFSAVMVRAAPVNSTHSAICVFRRAPVGAAT